VGRHHNHQKLHLVQRRLDLTPPTDAALHFGAVLSERDLGLFLGQTPPQRRGKRLPVSSCVREENAIASRGRSVELDSVRSRAEACGVLGETLRVRGRRRRGLRTLLEAPPHPRLVPADVHGCRLTSCLSDSRRTHFRHTALNQSSCHNGITWWRTYGRTSREMRLEATAELIFYETARNTAVARRRAAGARPSC
jgi:hypothetical protein